MFLDINSLRLYVIQMDSIKKNIKSFYLFSLLYALLGCEKSVTYDTSKIPKSNAIISEFEVHSFLSVVESKVYVPVYSNLQLEDEGLQVPLQATVSLRNTDLKSKLKISKITYYNTNGELVRDYISKPVVIKPFASHEVVVRTGDLDGGSGAKFIIQWESESETMSKPLIEAVFSGIRGSGAFSFSSRGVELN